MQWADRNEVINVLSEANSFNDVIVSKKGISSLYNFAKDVHKSGTEAFKETHNKAKITGKLLGHYFASENGVFQGRSISFIGFSLGCQVIKSALNRLYKLGRHDLVHNVYLLGGATFIGNPTPQFDRFSKVVAGRVVNVFTEDDSALKLFNYVFKC